MKKNIIISFVSIISLLFITAGAFAENKCLDGKLGTGYATDPEKFGWQLNFAFLTVLDPFFAIGFEPGIYWANWNRKIGREQVSASLEADVKADTNAYMIPFLGDAQIRLPNLKEKLHMLPYATFGLGYSVMILKYSQPSYVNTSGQDVSAENKTKLFHGLTWQVMAGVAYDPGPSSKIEFLAEFGYRGSKLKQDNLEVDMSGFIINIGVRYPFGGAAPANSI